MPITKNLSMPIKNNTVKKQHNKLHKMLYFNQKDKRICYELQKIFRGISLGVLEVVSQVKGNL